MYVCDYICVIFLTEMRSHIPVSGMQSQSSGRIPQIAVAAFREGPELWVGGSGLEFNVHFYSVCSQNSFAVRHCRKDTTSSRTPGLPAGQSSPRHPPQGSSAAPATVSMKLPLRPPPCALPLPRYDLVSGSLPVLVSLPAARGLIQPDSEVTHFRDSLTRPLDSLTPVSPCYTCAASSELSAVPTPF